MFHYIFRNLLCSDYQWLNSFHYCNCVNFVSQYKASRDYFSQVKNRKLTSFWRINMTQHHEASRHWGVAFIWHPPPSRGPFKLTTPDTMSRLNDPRHTGQPKIVAFVYRGGAAHTGRHEPLFNGPSGAKVKSWHVNQHEPIPKIQHFDMQNIRVTIYTSRTSTASWRPTGDPNQITTCLEPEFT